MGKSAYYGASKKRGFEMASKCPLCGEAEEDLNHLLIHCPSVWGLWEGLISFLGLDWVCPLSPKDLMLDWTNFPIRKRVRKLWRVAPFACFGQSRRRGTVLSSMTHLSSFLDLKHFLLVP